MRVETKYIANDGKEFDDEYDCRTYEYNQLKKENGIIMLDSDLKSTNNLEYCMYCIIKTEKDYDILQEISDYEGFTCPNEIGAYYYDCYDDEWYNLKNKIDELEEKLDRYRKIIEM